MALKRSPLTRKSGLKRSRMRRKPPETVASAPEPGRDAWNMLTSAARRCAHCGRTGRISGHHVVLERDVRSAGGDPWDQRNWLPVRHECHLAHHVGGDWQKIARSQLRPENLSFAAELLGALASMEYLERHYPATPIPRGERWVRSSLAEQASGN